MLFITVLILTQALFVVADGSCGCHNGGECEAGRLTCQCPEGFYGPICNQYGETYKLIFATTPNVKFTSIKDTLFRNLKSLEIKEFAEVGLKLGNVYKVTFYKTLTNVDRQRVKSTAAAASRVAVKELTDFDECVTGQSCFDGLACKNTIYSFQCGCPSGYTAKNFRCVQIISEDNKNTRTVIYVWAGAVGAVVLAMLGCLIFYRHRKIEKGRKILKEQEKKAAHRNVLTPTNLSEYDGHGGRRASPTASVLDGHMRQYSMPPDLASLYSYNQPYGQEPEFYRQQRLSIPIDGMQNTGYEQEAIKYPPTGSYGQQPQYNTMNSQDDRMSGRALGISPSNDHSSPFAGVTEQEKQPIDA